jgi:hypothetical protein
MYHEPTPAKALVDELPPCRGCDGHVERELIAIEPAAEVCLECMFL